MKTPAERFYEASYQQGETNLEKGSEAIALNSPGHRYSCVKRFLSMNRGLEAVELGFGTGNLIPSLADYTKSYTIVDVVDRRGSSDMPPQVKFQKADLNYDFPLINESFDCSIAMMIVEHLFDPFHSFRELARITKQKGRVFINLPNIASVKCRLQLAVGRMPVTSSTNWFEKREWDGNHLHNFTVKDTIRLATLNGLELIAVHPVGRNPTFKALAPSFLCHEISYEFLNRGLMGQDSAHL